MKKNRQDVYYKKKQNDFILNNPITKLTPCKFQYSFSLIQYLILQYHVNNQKYSLNVLIEYHHDKQYLITKKK